MKEKKNTLRLNSLPTCFFSDLVCILGIGAAFKTQKEVVKAIFVNNIGKLGHHYARVFEDSW